MYRQDELDDIELPSPSVRLVLLELGVHADRKGIVRMPQSELADHLGIAVRTVATAFSMLQDLGHLERLGHGRYQLVIGGTTSKEGAQLRAMQDWTMRRMKEIASDGHKVNYWAIRNGIARQFQIDPGEIIIERCMENLERTRRLVSEMTPVETNDGIRFAKHYTLPRRGKKTPSETMESGDPAESAVLAGSHQNSSSDATE